MRSHGWTHDEAKRQTLPDRLRERCATYSPTGESCDASPFPLLRDDWCERCLAADELERTVTQ